MRKSKSQGENQMPLKKSASKLAFGENVKAEMKSGKSQKQSVAIAYMPEKKSAEKKKMNEQLRNSKKTYG